LYKKKYKGALLEKWKESPCGKEREKNSIVEKEKKNVLLFVGWIKISL